MSGDLIKVLWVTPFPPYKGVRNAGGNTILFYTRMLAKEQGYKVSLMTVCHHDEVLKLEKSYDDTGADLVIVEHWDTGIKRIIRSLLNFESKYSFYNRNAGLLDNWTEYIILKRIKEMKQIGYSPDIVVLQFTQVLFLSTELKNLFPNCKIVAIEEDVAFQGYDRRRVFAKGVIERFKWDIRSKKLKELEIDLLNKVNLIITTNQKDIDLLEKEKVQSKKIMYSAFYQSFLKSARKYDENHHLIFYGAMNRDENWKSVLWFVDYVLPLIKDESVKLKIIGGNPHPSLKSIQHPQVEVLGFVEDISEVFSKAMCLVAPLVMGAGIKVKVLEGLSAGIPILTNNIGIEGIPAIDKKHYFHCETPEEYRDAINLLISGEVDLKKMEKEEKELISSTFDYHETYKTLLGEFSRLL